MKVTHFNTSISHFYDFYSLYRCDEKYALEANWHEDLELLFTLKGENTFLINGEKVTLKENDIYIINPNYPHSSMGEREGHTSILTIRNNFLLENGFKEINGLFNEKFCDSVLFQKFNNLLDIHFSNDKFREVDFRIALMDMLRHVFKHHYNESEVSGKSYKIKNILRYIEKNYTENIRLDDLAFKFGLNKNYLSGVFKKETGFNVIKYVNLLRCGYAESLIKSTTLKMNEIAIMAGFGSVSNFNKIYKSIRNKTPIVTRNDNKQYLENGRGLGRRLKKQIELPIE